MAPVTLVVWLEFNCMDDIREPDRVLDENYWNIVSANKKVRNPIY